MLSVKCNWRPKVTALNLALLLHRHGGGCNSGSSSSSSGIGSGWWHRQCRNPCRGYWGYAVAAGGEHSI
jgi:hypothetical protein